MIVSQDQIALTIKDGKCQRKWRRVMIFSSRQQLDWIRVFNIKMSVLKIQKTNGPMIFYLESERPPMDDIYVFHCPKLFYSLKKKFHFIFYSKNVIRVSVKLLNLLLAKTKRYASTTFSIYCAKNVSMTLTLTGEHYLF